MAVRLFEGTEFDRPPRCERCGELEENCTCPPAARSYAPPRNQTAKLGLEKRKKGKIVTIVRGLSAEESDLPVLLTQLKTICGAGGTLKNEVIEIQGEHLDRIRARLRELGYRVSG